MIDAAYQRTRELLVTHRDALEKVAQTLLKREVIFKDDLKTIIGERPWPEPGGIEIVDAVATVEDVHPPVIPPVNPPADPEAPADPVA